METVKLDYDDNSTPEASLKRLDSIGSVEISDICGDPQMEPRVGDQYQVEIPPMITEAERLQLLMNPFDSDAMVGVSHLFLIGLPIPLAWIYDEVNGNKDERQGLPCSSSSEVGANRSVGSGNGKVGHVIDLKRKGSKLKPEPFTINLDQEIESIPVNLQSKVEENSSLDQVDKVISCFPVPGSLGGGPWSDADVNSFLLGLYIYGKNFVRVMRFMENKEMGEILSFYYGQFYKSDGYRRWSSSRNTRNRKCVNGHKIFAGWRQQELISRLLPHVIEESQTTLVEVSKAFAEQKTSLDDYISYIKSAVGIHVLVEAVGIGKGKEDLTGLAADSVKTKQHFPVCPKIPTGQACSSLTPNDIIKFLTGGFRLSKARCNDIFWEAVWPRLLARGWHSEQPKNRGCPTSKNYLVFLMPGVQKFSRRKLVKGIQYFDSVTDVLGKVASEPRLLELEAEETRGSCRSGEENVERDDLSDDQRHRYLKPQISTCNVNHMKFTVVDTSLAHEGKSLKIRELRPLPVELKRASKNEGRYSDDSEEESDPDAGDRPSYGENKHVISKHGKAISNGGSDSMKFTVVDTTLVRGGKSSKLGVRRYSSIGFTSDLVSLQRENLGGSLNRHEQDMAIVALNGKKNAINARNRKDIFDNGARLHKFSVVDTSVVREGRSSDIAELRYLPLDLTSELTSKRESVGNNSSEDSLGEHDSDTADIPLNCEKRLKNANQSESLSDGSDSNQNAKIDDSGEGNEMDFLQNQKTFAEKKPKTIKFHFSRRPKSGNSSSLALPTKRRRLTACVKAETSRIAKIFSVGSESKELESCCALESRDASNNDRSQVVPSEKLSSVSCSAEDCMEEERSRGIVSSNCESFPKTSEKAQPQALIDLNLPQFPLDPMICDSNRMEVESSHGDPNANELCSVSNTEELVEDHEALVIGIGLGAVEQANLNPRRQSTRNRPLTAKALEALANGYLNMNNRRKRSEARSQDNLFTSPSRRARSRMRVASHYGSTSTGSVEVKEEKEEKGGDELYECSLHSRAVDLA